MNRAANTILWALAQSWGGRSIIFVIFVVLSRILNPAEFGLAAASTLVILLASQVAEFGFGDALVQKDKLDDDEVNVPFLISITLSLVLALGLFKFSKEIEKIFQSPGLAVILRWTAFLPPFYTLSIFQEIMYRRNLKFKALAIRIVVANTAAGVVAIIVALAGGGAWSLVVQSALALAIGISMLWSRPIWKPTLQITTRSLPKIFRFSYKVFFARIMEFVGQRLVEIIIVRYYGLAALGLYAAGSRMYQTLMLLLQTAIADVGISLLARMNGDLERVRDIYRRTCITSATLSSPVFAICSALSPEICDVLFGTKWVGVDRICAPLLALGALQCVQFVNGAYFNAMGHPSAGLVLNIIKTVVVMAVLMMFAGVEMGYLVGLFVAAQLVMTPLSFGWISKLLKIPIFEIFKPLARLLAVNCVCYFSVYELRPFLQVYIDVSFLRGCALGLIYLVLYAGGVWLLRTELQITLSLLKKFKARS